MGDPDLKKVDEAIAKAIDAKTTASRPVEPVRVTVIGTGDGSRLEPGMVATTEGEHQPNLVIAQVIPPFIAILVGSGHLFFVTLVGLLSAAMTPAGSKLLYTGDFLHMLGTCVSLALPIVIFGVLKDLATVFGRLRDRFPLLTGRV